MGTQQVSLNDTKRQSPLDEVVRALAFDGFVRVLACTSTRLVNEMQRRHQTWPVATAALGRTATIAAMMGLLLKGEERLTVQIKGDGPIGAIMVDADSGGHVRGYVANPRVHLPANDKGKLDVGGGVGNGSLYVMRDMGLKDVYRGTVELQSGEIADDFTYYFAKSEQTPSAVAAGVLVDTDNTVIVSGGFIIQLMPGHDETHVHAVEECLQDVKSVTEMLSEGMDVDGLLNRVFPQARVVQRQPIGFRCTCSRDRLENVLKSIGDDELQAMIDEDGQAEVICHFCGEAYLFSREDLLGLMK